MSETFSGSASGAAINGMIKISNRFLINLIPTYTTKLTRILLLSVR